MNASPLIVRRLRGQTGRFSATSPIVSRMVELYRMMDQQSRKTVFVPLI